jgi:hypothetical protein
MFASKLKLQLQYLLILSAAVEAELAAASLAHATEARRLQAHILVLNQYCFLFFL